MKNLWGCLLAMCIVLGGGCVQNNYPTYTPPQKNYTIDYSKASYNDKQISISIAPSKNIHTGSIEGFILSVENKTNDDINIVWNDSYYINENSPDGGFMFGGVVYSKRTDPKQDMLVFPKTTRDIDIFPNSKVEYMRPTVVAHSVLPGGWFHNDLGIGVHGAYIMVKGKGINKKIKLLLTVS